MSDGRIKNNVLVGAVAVSAAAVAMVCLYGWLTMPAPDYVKIRLADGVDQQRAASLTTEDVEIGALFERFDGAVGSGRGSWPCFRGTNADNISSEGVKLAEVWPASGPPVLWTIALGEGYAGPAIHAGGVYVLDYDGDLGADMLRCFSLDDGKEIWRRGYVVQVKRNHGMSRTIPAVTDQYVVTMGPKCHVMCVAADSGDLLWGLDLVKQFGTEIPLWYTGQCPFMDGEIAVLAPGGSSLLIGVNCSNGEIVWKTPNPKGWKMSHASVVPMTLAGRRMYVYCAPEGMTGVAADGEDRGQVLWDTTEWSKTVVAPSPVAVGEDRILVTAGYGAGSMLFTVTAENGAFAVRPLSVWDRKVFACEQHTPIVYEGHLFTVMPKDAGELREQLVCMRPDGTLVWASGKDAHFGLGPFMIAEGRILLMDDGGLLTMAVASTRAYEPLASAAVLSGRESWAPLAIAGGRLLARDFRQLVCLDMR